MAAPEVAGLDRRALDRARLSRDPRFDGKFFIAVRSTGIYCRSICPVRSPRPANISYFATAAAAAAAGFRPCLRCRPEAAPGTPAWSGTCAVVARALRLIDDHALDTGSVASLAARAGVGPRHLHRLFVQHVGAPPLAVAHTRRMHAAKRLLDDTSLSITEIALAAGFGSVRRFNDAFRRTYGRPPRELRGRRAPAADRGDETVLRLAYRPPYDWASIRDFLAARALPGVERVAGNVYARTIAIGEGHATISVRPIDGEHALELRLGGVPPATVMPVVTGARRMFDLSADPSAIAAALARDALLGPLLRARPGLRIAGAWDPFECAVRAILGQQVTVAAGRTLAIRLVSRLGRPVPARSDDEGLTHLFPSAQAIADGDLDHLGIMPARAGALRALARAVLDGRVDFTRPAESVVRHVAALPGCGEWTANYVAMRALNDPDAFLAGDIVLRRAVSQDARPSSPRALAARAAAWRPWRAYAVMHLWAAAHSYRNVTVR